MSRHNKRDLFSRSKINKLSLGLACIAGTLSSVGNALESVAIHDPVLTGQVFRGIKNSFPFLANHGYDTSGWRALRSARYSIAMTDDWFGDWAPERAKVYRFVETADGTSEEVVFVDSNLTSLGMKWYYNIDFSDFIEVDSTGNLDVWIGAKYGDFFLHDSVLKMKYLGKADTHVDVVVNLDSVTSPFTNIVVPFDDLDGEPLDGKISVDVLFNQATLEVSYNSGSFNPTIVLYHDLGDLPGEPADAPCVALSENSRYTTYDDCNAMFGQGQSTTMVQFSGTFVPADLSNSLVDDETRIGRIHFDLSLPNQPGATIVGGEIRVRMSDLGDASTDGEIIIHRQ